MSERPTHDVFRKGPWPLDLIGGTASHLRVHPPPEFTFVGWGDEEINALDEPVPVRATLTNVADGLPVRFVVFARLESSGEEIPMGEPVDATVEGGEALGYWTPALFNPADAPEATEFDEHRLPAETLFLEDVTTFVPGGFGIHDRTYWVRAEAGGVARTGEHPLTWTVHRQLEDDLGNPLSNTEATVRTPLGEDVQVVSDEEAFIELEEVPYGPVVVLLAGEEHAQIHEERTDDEPIVDDVDDDGSDLMDLYDGNEEEDDDDDEDDPPEPTVGILELEDVHFGLERCILLPTRDPGAGEEADRATGLAVVRAAFVYMRDHDKKLLVAGHTDTTGSDAFNLELSADRADNAYLYLTGDRSGWAAHCQAHFDISDFQAVHKWLALSRGWEGCDPGPVDGEWGEKSRLARNAFRERINTHYGGSLVQGSKQSQADWEAIFDVYDEALREALEVDEAGLAELRAGLTFTDPPTLPCGEEYPRDRPDQDSFESAANRRVELLFFDPDEVPELPGSPAGAPIYGPDSELKQEFLDVDPDPEPDPLDVFRSDINLTLRSDLTAGRVPNALYTLELPDGPVEGQTDDEGRIRHDDVPPGDYAVTVFVYDVAAYSSVSTSSKGEPTIVSAVIGTKARPEDDEPPQVGADAEEPSEPAASPFHATFGNVEDKANRIRISVDKAPLSSKGADPPRLDGTRLVLTQVTPVTRELGAFTCDLVIQPGEPAQVKIENASFQASSGEGDRLVVELGDQTHTVDVDMADPPGPHKTSDFHPMDLELRIEAPGHDPVTVRRRVTVLDLEDAILDPDDPSLVKLTSPHPDAPQTASAVAASTATPPAPAGSTAQEAESVVKDWDYLKNKAGTLKPPHLIFGHEKLVMVPGYGDALTFKIGHDKKGNPIEKSIKGVPPVYPPFPHRTLDEAVVKAACSLWLAPRSEAWEWHTLIYESGGKFGFTPPCCSRSSGSIHPRDLHLPIHLPAGYTGIVDMHSHPVMDAYDKSEEVMAYNKAKNPFFSGWDVLGWWAVPGLVLCNDGWVRCPPSASGHIGIVVNDPIAPPPTWEEKQDSFGELQREVSGGPKGVKLFHCSYPYDSPFITRPS